MDESSNAWIVDAPSDGGGLYRILNATSLNATHNSTESYADNDFKNDGKSLGQILWIFVGPVIFVTGVIGNILVLAVMGRRRMHGTSTSFYLRIMALADLMVLVTGMIPEWLEQADIVVV